MAAPYKKNRLRKKLLTLFLVAALIPLVTISGVVYQYTSDYVNEQAERRLTKESSILNATLFERLSILKQLVEDGSLDQLSDDARSRYVRAEALVTPRPNLARSTAANVTTDADTRLFFEANSPHGRKRYEINPNYLYGGFSILSKEFDYCLLSAKETLWCSSPLASKEQILWHKIDVTKHSKGFVSLSDHSDKAALQFVARPLFMGKEILVDHWLAFASVPAETTRAPVELFKQLFLAVFALTLLTIGLVSYHQFRRILSPLTVLMRGADNLSRKNFSQPVEIESHDEFEDLGKAFNHMSKRIENSFDIMNSLSEIDRLLLQTNDINKITTTAWTRTQRVIRGQLLLIATTESASLTTLSLLSGGPEQVAPKTQHLQTSPAALEFITKMTRPTSLSLQHFKNQQPDFLAELEQFQVDTLQTVPITLDGAWRGFVAWGDSHGVGQSSNNEYNAILEGLADRLAVSMSNISKQNKLYHMAHFDYLTQLPNRKLLRDRLKQGIADACQSGHQIAVLLADLDNFKQVNDSLGHAVGDKLLVDISQRLSKHLGAGNTVAREGGDEFIILLPQVHDRESVREKVEEIMSLFDEPVILAGHHIYISMSLGIAMYPEHGTRIDRLLMQADTALYKSKSLGKSNFLFFEEGMNTDALKRLEIESALWKTIENNELLFHYQPLINTTNNSISFEALIRWIHPDKGFVSPEIFIPIAEETGYIMEINQWMFDEILGQVKAWSESRVPFDKVAINISPLQLLMPGFAQIIQSKIEQFGIDPSKLEFELTESVFLENQQHAAQRLNELKALGVSLALDDFGTGYSSLSYLQKLPFDRLKIDRSFVSNIPDGAKLPPLVLTIIRMAKSLDLSITAEGVEHAYQFELLKDMGCQILQGYHISKPIPANECIPFIEHYASHSPKKNKP